MTYYFVSLERARFEARRLQCEERAPWEIDRDAAAERSVLAVPVQAPLSLRHVIRTGSRRAYRAVAWAVGETSRTAQQVVRTLVVFFRRAAEFQMVPAADCAVVPALPIEVITEAPPIALEPKLNPSEPVGGISP